jgi:hypothetical protein
MTALLLLRLPEPVTTAPSVIAGGVCGIPILTRTVPELVSTAGAISRTVPSAVTLGLETSVISAWASSGTWAKIAS